MIRDLGLRLRRVDAVAKTATVGTYNVKAELTPVRKSFDRSLLNDSVFQAASNAAMNAALAKTATERAAATGSPLKAAARRATQQTNEALSHRFRVRTPYIDIDGTVERDSLSASIEVRDTLVQVLHRVPRFKFLGIWFGTQGVRQEVISKNPHTRIVAAEYIELTR